MAQLADRPFPPGSYPVLIVGSGPGALQTSYGLRSLGVAHAVISADPEPGGMFRRFPLFQRLVTWTKPFSPVDAGSRRYERFDWNSLITEESADRALVRRAMTGSESYFPTRPEMEEGLVEFVRRSALDVRHGCTWLSTTRTDDGYVLTTSDGDYTAPIVVFAVGMTEAWKPDIPGMKDVTHYVDVESAADYRDKVVFVIGKRNSGYEIANALLPHARQVILGSPRPSRISVIARSTAAARARYLQPYEDHVLGGGHFSIDAAIERIERTSKGWKVHTAGTTVPGERVFEVDDVIAATGFTTPLGDLADVGVETFYKGRLPAQTSFWESRSAPGIYFAGSITQGSIGLKKYGIPSNSAAVHGFRYNALVLARHLAEAAGGTLPAPARIESQDLVGFLLEEATFGPELWNQQAYLARVVTVDGDIGLIDAGIQPLAHFVDEAGPDSVAVTVETDTDGDIHPAVYVRKDQHVSEHLLSSDLLHDFTGDGARQRQLASALEPLGVR